MLNGMKDHPATYAMLIALALILIALVTLSSEGMKGDGPVLLGLVGAVGVICGGIVGKQSSSNGQPQNPQLPQLSQVAQLPQQPQAPP